MIYKTFDIKAVAIERTDPEADVPCGECNQCCIGLTPILTPDEFAQGKFVYTLINSPDPSKPPTIAIPRDPETGCYYLKDGKCSVYEDRPLACRQFDCRKNHYPPFRQLVIDKFGIDPTEEPINES